MAVRTTLTAGVLRCLLSARWQTLSRASHEMHRRLRGREHIVDVWLRLDDPYSLLLLRRLRFLANAYVPRVRLHYIGNDIPLEFAPAPKLIEHYARHDAALLAGALGERFADCPARHYSSGVAAVLAMSAEQLDFDAGLDTALETTEAYWRGDETAASRRRGSH